MATTADRTFEVAYSLTPRDADVANLRVQTTTGIGGTASGSDITLAAGPLTEVEMVQYHPGLFTYTTTGGRLTRGQTYRAFYSIEVGGSEAETHTQDFTATGDTFDSLLARDPHVFTVARLEAYISAVLGESDGANPGTSTRLEVINDALQMIWDEHQWQFRDADPWQLSLVAGQFRYRLPIDVTTVDQVIFRNDNTRVAIQIPIDDIVRLREQEPTSTPLAIYWATRYDATSDDPTTEGRYVLEVWPTPVAFEDRALQVRYQRRPLVLCKTTDVIPLPNGFHTLVKHAVAWLAAEDVGMDAELTARWERRYRMSLERAKKADGRYGPSNLGSMRQRPSALDEELDPFDPRRHIDPYATEVRN